MAVSAAQLQSPAVLGETSKPNRVLFGFAAIYEYDSMQRCYNDLPTYLPRSRQDHHLSSPWNWALGCPWHITSLPCCNFEARSPRPGYGARHAIMMLHCMIACDTIMIAARKIQHLPPASMHRDPRTLAYLNYACLPEPLPLSAFCQLINCGKVTDSRQRSNVRDFLLCPGVLHLVSYPLQPIEHEADDVLIHWDTPLAPHKVVVVYGCKKS
ncbi:hypothetical protein BJV78DRAFT_590763 [Lactifluus subvellereus]|nr:hypothetical protein BJV78DRAFT_590763 [Lactifluus subvellereus]